MNRLVHIDFLKGLAIFLMVMGHVLSWSMADSGCPRTVDSWFVREVIYFSTCHYSCLCLAM